MTRRPILDVVNLLAALIASAVITDVAGANGAELELGAGINSDLNVAALVVAVGTLLTGIVAYARLRSERPKIIQEVGALTEERLRKALETSWEEVDRCRIRIIELEALEEWHDDCIDLLVAACRNAGIPVPPLPPRPAPPPARG